MNIEKIHALLERLRTEYIAKEEGRVFYENRLFELDGETFKLNVWQDFHGAEQFVIFEIKPGSVLCTESFCLGLKYSAQGAAILLTQEQLRTIGIP